MIYFFIVIISLMLHELAHYIAAVCCGVGVRKFCIFWDPGFHLFSTGRRFKTEFCLGWLPLGGYVALKPSDSGNPDRKGCLAGKPLRARLLFYSSGLLVNLALAFGCTYIYTDRYFDPMGVHSVACKLDHTVRHMKRRTASFYQGLLHTSAHHEGKSGKATSEIRKGKKHVKAVRKRENEWLRVGLWQFADVNMMLFLLNLLPVPPLDGGFISLQLCRRCSGSMIDERAQTIIVCIGVVLLILFFTFSYMAGIIQYLKG